MSEFTKSSKNMIAQGPQDYQEDSSTVSGFRGAHNWNKSRELQQNRSCVTLCSHLQSVTHDLFCYCYNFFTVIYSTYYQYPVTTFQDFTGNY